MDLTTTAISEKFLRFENIGAILAAPLVVWAWVHAIRHRTLGEIVHYSTYISVPLVVVLLVALIVVWRRTKFRKPATSDLWIVGALGFLCIGAGFGYYAVGVSLKDAYGWWQTTRVAPVPVIGVVGVVLATGVLGGALFYFRLRLRSVYGFTEIVIGLVIAGQKMAEYLSLNTWPKVDSDLFLTLLTAGVYLVVRGMDNVHQGATKDPRDAVASLVLQKFAELAKPTSAQSAVTTQN